MADVWKTWNVLAQFFTIWFFNKIYVWSHEKSKLIFDPRGQRQDSWLWGNTSRRHRSWLRGAWSCTAGHPRWRWRGRYLEAVDLGFKLGAMDPDAEHGKPTAKFPLPRLFSFLPPNPSNLLNRRIWLWILGFDPYIFASKVSSLPLSIFTHWFSIYYVYFATLDTLVPNVWSDFTF